MTPHLNPLDETAHLNPLDEMVHLNPLDETVQMRGHNMFSMRNKKNYHKILPLIWSSENEVYSLKKEYAPGEANSS